MKNILASILFLTLASCSIKTSEVEPLDGDFDEMDDFIIVDEPIDGDIASCPLQVSGEARGYWYFEATFPFELRSESGDIISSGFVTALDDWMTEDYVPFEFDIFYDTPEESGVLILKKSNASGLPEHDMQIEIAVKFSTCEEDEAILEEDLELPVIVFSAAGSIPDDVEQEILDRVINPFVDYYTEKGEIILSVQIEPMDSMSKDINYSFSYIYANGVNGGSAIFEDKNGIKYWSPDCMVCEFSEEYRTKYPEVVKGY